MSASTRNSAESPSHEGGLSPFVMACFTLNYIIGTGFLTLPWAFEQAGAVLSAIGMVIVCMIANVGSDYILTAMARADAVACYLQTQGYALGEENKDRSVITNATNTNESTSLLQGSEEIYGKKLDRNEVYNKIDTALPADLKKPRIMAKFSMDFGDTEAESCETNEEEYNDTNGTSGLLIVGEKKYELTELSKMFLGRNGLKAYGVAVVLDVYGFLWAYTSVFGAAMDHSFPVLGEGIDSYPLWVFVFALIVVPMSFLGLSEQATMQVFLSGCRIIMILLMVLTPIVAAVMTSGNNDSDMSPPNPHFGELTKPAGAPMFAPSSIHEMIPILVFSVLFHQAVPGLADEITEKSTAGTVFGLTFILCGCAYSLIGVVVAWYFGEGVYESSNINWESYHGGTGTLVFEDGEYKWTGVAWYFKMISLFVVCFPAVDVISAFPLNAFVLGNSIMGLVYIDSIHEVEKNRRIRTTYRAIAALPPIFGALLVRDLGLITDYSGLTGLAIAFCFPALLYINSEKKAKELGIPYRTRYERFGSSIRSAKAMFIFGVVAIAYCSALLVAEG